MSHPTPVVQGTTLAKLFRLDKARFEQLVQEKVVPENAQGQFELVASVRGYVMHLQTRAQGQADKTIDIKSQQLRRMKAQADELELELACMQAQSHPVRDVKTRWSRKVVAVKIGFLSMADRLAQMLTLTETDRDVMDQAIRSALIGLSAKDETAPSASSQVALKAGVMRLYCPPPNLTVTQWAEANRILSRENCALPGPYRVSVTPYLKEMLDCITDRTVERVVCQKSAQVAWTDGVINNAVGYYIDQDPAPMLILFPTDGMAKRYSKEKLAPMIRDTPLLTEKVADAKSRDSGNTLESKNFQGGHLELVGSNAPSKLASSPIRIIMVEEPDRCARNAGGEGNSLKLVYERGKTFHNRKIILGGSPTIKGVSEIEREMELSDQRRLYIACPHCQAYQTLEWAQVVWDQDEARNHSVYGQHDPDTARFTCKHCAQDFSNAQKNKALLQGEWRADKPFNGTAGFYLSELHSPFPKARVQDMAAKFLEAKKYLEQGDPTLMITWTNTSLGETWEEIGETVEHHFLYQRREHYTARVPAGSLILTAGVDTQDDRLECEIVAWGLGEESYSIDYIRLYGDLTKPGVWNILAEMLRKTYAREDGVLMDIKTVCIDSGGHFTDEVYQFSKKHGVRWMVPIKGASTPGRPVADFPRTKNKKGVYLTLVGTDTAKETIYQRYNLMEPGPGYCHWPINDTYDEEYFKQATAETKVKKYRRGMEYYEWTKGAGQRNEALDCRVYAFAAIRILQQHRKVNLEKLQRLYEMEKDQPSARVQKRRRRKPRGHVVPSLYFN